MKQRQTEFFQLVNEDFYILNPRIKDDKQHLKCSDGMYLNEQEQVFNQFYFEIQNMKIVGLKSC